MPPITKNQARGAAIAFARNLRGMTQKQLADAIGVSKNTQVRTEGGHRSIDVDELDDIADALAWDADWLKEPPVPSSVELGPSVGWDVSPAHNVVDLDANGQVIEGPWGNGPDGGTPVQMRLPRAA